MVLFETLLVTTYLDSSVYLLED